LGYILGDLKKTHLVTLVVRETVQIKVKAHFFRIGFFSLVKIRVARWYICIPKFPLWVNFGVPWNLIMLIYFMVIWYILWSFGIFCGHLVYFVVIWYILWSFGIFCGHLVYFVVIWYILLQFGIFYGHLVYFAVMWYILWSFGIFCGHLVYFIAIWHILWSFGIFCGHVEYISRFCLSSR
jgi:hypothetical protein